MTAWSWNESASAFWSRMSHEESRPPLGDLVRELRPPAPTGAAPAEHGDLRELVDESRRLLPKTIVRRAESRRARIERMTREQQTAGLAYLNRNKEKTA